LVLCRSTAAAAEPRDPIDLEWTAPAECPRVDAVRARLRELAGPRQPRSQTFRAEVTITRKPDGALHLRLLVRSGSLAGERNMDGKSCKVLAGAAAVTLVLMLHSTDPSTESDSTGSSAAASNGDKAPTTPASEAPTDSTTTGDPAANAAAKRDSARGTVVPPAASDQRRSSLEVHDDERAHQRRWHLLLQFPQIEVGLGPLHQPSLGLAIAGGTAFDRWRFLAKGSFWFSQHTSAASDTEQAYGADVDRTTATFLACRAVVLSWFELSPCVSLAIQHVSARGTGAHVGGRTGTATWFGIGAGGQARARIAPWLNLFLGLDAQLQMAQPLLSVDEIGPVERLLPVAVTAVLGSEWNF